MHFANYLAVSSALSVSINNWLTKVPVDECRDSRVESRLPSVNQDRQYFRYTHTHIYKCVVVCVACKSYRVDIVNSPHCLPAGNLIVIIANIFSINKFIYKSDAAVAVAVSCLNRLCLTKLLFIAHWSTILWQWNEQLIRQRE